jgi:hypothetical protein
MPIAPPANGRIGACNLRYGSTCTVHCNEGYAPSNSRNATGIDGGVIGATGPTVLRCDSSSKSWEGTVPACDECARNYYKQRGVCLPCSSAECPAGMYRAPCTGTEDARCVACTALLPGNAYFATGGSPYYQDNCVVVCKAGYYLSSSGTSCVPVQPSTPAVAVALPSITSLSETYMQIGPVVIALSLTVPPSSPVYLTITVSRQLTHMDHAGVRLAGVRPAKALRTKVVTFTPDNYAQIQNVSVDAWDDVVYEGDHSGVVYWSVESADPGYNRMQVCMCVCIHVCMFGSVIPLPLVIHVFSFSVPFAHSCSLFATITTPLHDATRIPTTLSYTHTHTHTHKYGLIRTYL